jgi:hypothetical protein
MKANYKDTEFMFNYKKIILRRGQLITGLNELSSSTGVTKSKCYRILKCLENENLIEIQKTNRYSMISIVCYDKYQSNETLNETPVKLQRNSGETLVKTSKELISIKEYKNNNNPAHRAGSPQGILMDAFRKNYQDNVGEPYLAKKSDYILIANLIKEMGEINVREKMKLLLDGCADKSFWFSKNDGIRAFTIGNLVRHWPDIFKREKEEVM